MVCFFFVFALLQAIEKRPRHIGPCQTQRAAEVLATRRSCAEHQFLGDLGKEHQTKP